MTPALDERLRALIWFAAATADGDEALLQAAVADLRAAGCPPVGVDELVLQSVLTVGWPRALVAAGAWRAVAGATAAELDDIEYARHDEWTRRGEATCRLIYGDHYDRLRANVRQLHPALDVWMVTEGYGRTLSRPGLAVAVRELCTVAQTVVLRTPRQLHSHLLGALRAGATVAEVEATVALAASLIGDVDRDAASALWRRVRNGWMVER